jgi:hypothetical protein
VDVDAAQSRRGRDVLVESIATSAQRARERARANLDDRSRRNMDRSLARAASRQRSEELEIRLSIELHRLDCKDALGRCTYMIRQARAMQTPHRMGYVSRHKRRDLSKYETVWQDPDYDRLAASDANWNRGDKLTTGMLAGGSMLETIGGLAAVILAVLGFSHQPIEMASLATIAIGIALLSQGASIMARWRRATRVLDGPKPDRDELVEGLSTEVFGGSVGIVLGVLGLVGMNPLIMLPVATVVYGGSLLLGGAVQPGLVHLAPERNPRIARATYSVIQTSGNIMVLVGIAAAVLGILALLAIGPPLAFVLIATLTIGFALLVAGGALTTRFVRRFT